MNLDSFTFITLSYNQQKYIVEHLESIRQVAKSYGKGIKIDYILADDCSKDETILIVKGWLDKNSSLFRNIFILDRNQNVGIVRNVIDVVGHVKTRHFKILAADDRFVCKDLFSLYDDIADNLIVTPVNPVDIIGNREPNAAKSMEKSFNLIRLLRTPRRIERMLRCENFLPAPGIFIPGDFFRDNKFQEFLLRFHNIEDYPMFYYFLSHDKCGVKILNECYVDYRVGSGISTSKDMEKAKEFHTELRELYKMMDIRLYKYPKYINPYKYYFKIARIIANLIYSK